MIYQSRLDERLDLFQKKPVFLWGDLDCMLLLEEKMRSSGIFVSGFVIHGELEQASLPTNLSAPVFSPQMWEEEVVRGAKEEVLVQLAFWPLFRTYEKRILSVKNQWERQKGVTFFETRELLGWFLFQECLETLGMTKEEGEKRLGQFYEDLTDEVSKNILKARIGLSFHPHHSAFTLLYQQLDETIQKNHLQQLQKQPCVVKNDQPVVFYGIGINTHQSVAEHHVRLRNPEILEGSRVFCDKSRSAGRGSYQGSLLVAPETLRDAYPSSTVVICSTTYQQEIYDFLLQQGFETEQLFCVLRVDDKNQYFDEEIISFGEDEIFVDVGVFDGGTSVLFSQKCNYKQIYLFEPNTDFFQVSKDHLEEHQVRDYTLIPKGAWSEETVLRFGGEGISFGVDSSLEGEGVTELPVTTLDTALEDVAVTFLKMDIEGAEYEALLGASELIRRNKPKLAISIYHKPEDLLQIQQLIKSLVPEYRFYLRQYQTDTMETVLYAVIEG